MVTARTQYFGTKTVYTPPDNVLPVQAPEGTRLLHVSLLARHGTRNPTVSSLLRLRALQRWLNSTIPEAPWLSEFSDILRVYEADPGALTAHGVLEMRALGVRFRTVYGEPAAPAATRVRASCKKRAINSARAFMEGFLQTQRADECGVQVLPEGRDAPLRYFERDLQYACFARRHKASRAGNLGKGAVPIAARMSMALGSKEFMRPELVRIVAEACAFDYAHGRADNSELCKLLMPEDAPFLEVYDRAYRPYFKGHERFRSLAAPLVADIAESLLACVRAVRSGSSEYVATDLRFAHAQTLVPLLLLLGIETNGLKPDSPGYSKGLSAMSPFAANLAVELYAPVSETSSFKVRFRLHERYVETVPALEEYERDGSVELERLLEFFRDVLEEAGMECTFLAGSDSAGSE